LAVSSLQLTVGVRGTGQLGKTVVGLQTENCKPKTANCKLQTADCRLQTHNERHLITRERCCMRARTSCVYVVWSGPA